MSYLTWFDPSKADNITRDWNKVQGMTNISDEHIQIRRDLNVRPITIENSGVGRVGIAITTYYGDPLPQIQFILEPGEVKAMGINSVGSPMQYIHILDPATGRRSGHCTSFRTDCNQFVLREGMNGWFVQFFQRTAFRPAK